MDMLGPIIEATPFEEHERLIDDESLMAMQQAYDQIIKIDDWKNMIMMNTFTPDDGCAYWVYDSGDSDHSAFEQPPNGAIPIGVRVFAV